jgi:hypothetical protein
MDDTTIISIPLNDTVEEGLDVDEWPNLTTTEEWATVEPGKLSIEGRVHQNNLKLLADHYDLVCKNMFKMIRSVYFNAAEMIHYVDW